MHRAEDRWFTKLPVAIWVVLGCALWAADIGGPMHFLVTNDDTARSFPPSTVGLYSIGPDGHLTGPTAASTGGNGMAAGYFGIARVVIADNGQDACVFASNAQSETIAGIDARTHMLAGVFRGSRADNKLARDGIGLAVSGDHLFATFSGSNNIGAFLIQPGCKLQFGGDVHALGLNNGSAEGIAVHGNLMVVTFGDGSAESFDISGSLPVSHGDALYLTGPLEDLAPGAADITRDGRFAIFGGGSTASAVLVSDISSGKIGPPTTNELGTAWSSGSVRLSADERVLYVSNNSGGRVTAAYFDKETGKVRKGCTSKPLKGFYTKFTYIGGVATELATGTGGHLYVPEYSFDGKSSIGTLRFTSTGTGCTLTETVDSPIAASPGSAVLSIGVFPPRPF